MKEKENSHTIAFRAANLKPDENIHYFLDGWIGDMMGSGDKQMHNGAFILTNMRACFYRKGIFGEVLETIPLSKITSVETLSMMGYRLLRLHTSHDELAFKTFETKELFEKVYSCLEELRHVEDAPVARNFTAKGDPLAQLSKLGELKNAGILTDEEFTAKKAELLSRM